MKKLSIRKKFLAFLITGNVLLTGCSYSGDMELTKKDNSNNLSFSQSSIDEKSNNYESSYDASSNVDNSFKEESSKLESNEDSTDDVYINENEISDFDSVSLNEISDSIKEESELDEISEELCLEDSEEEICSVVDISEFESSIEELSIEESSEAESSIIEETTEEISELESSTFEESIDESTEVESSLEESIDEKYLYDDVYTDDSKYIKAHVYAYLRKEPNPSGKALKLINPGDTFKKIGYSGEYYIVEYDGDKAYVAMDYTEEIEKNQEIDINNNSKMIDLCYFPYGATLYSDKDLTNIIKEIPSLESGEIYSRDDNVYYIETDGNRGYVSKNSVSILSQPTLVVDESDQMTYYYDNNYIMIEYPVVTGSLNTPTTKGLHNIFRVSYGATLVGPTWEVDVGVFMPFTVYGEGFHDATWRGYYEFGGTTYEYNGSHGCVNMRYDDAFELADKVDESMKSGKEVKVLVKR